VGIFSASNVPLPSLARDQERRTCQDATAAAVAFSSSIRRSLSLLTCSSGMTGAVCVLGVSAITQAGHRGIWRQLKVCHILYAMPRFAPADRTCIDEQPVASPLICLTGGWLRPVRGPCPAVGRSSSSPSRSSRDRALAGKKDNPPSFACLSDLLP
jgi:hypothetical protein